MHDRGTGTPDRDTGPVAVRARAAPARRRDLLPRPSSPSRSRSSRRRSRSPTRSRPGAERLTLFHIVAAGSCWVAGDDGERHWADAGDVIVLPYGDHHVIGGDGPAETVSILSAARPAAVVGSCRRSATAAAGAHRSRVRVPAVRRPAVRSGAAGVPARVRRAPARRPAAGWVQASIEYAMEESRPVERAPERGRDPAAGAGAHRGAARCTSRPRRPPTTVGSRRCTIPCSLRRSRSSTPHPERRWTVPSSRPAPRCPGRCSTSGSARCSGGRRSATSRSGGCTSPRSCSPRPTSPVFAIARRVGYDSEEAFSRAFKRARGAVAEPLACGHATRTTRTLAGLAPPSGHASSRKAIWSRGSRCRGLVTDPWVVSTGLAVVGARRLALKRCCSRPR